MKKCRHCKKPLNNIEGWRTPHGAECDTCHDNHIFAESLPNDNAIDQSDHLCPCGDVDCSRLPHS